MDKFEKYKENGLSQEAESKLNTIRGCVLGSFLDNKKKKELLDFMNELEEYFDEKD